MRRSARLSARRSIAANIEEHEANNSETPSVVRNIKTRPSNESSTVRRKERLRKLARTIVQTGTSNEDSVELPEKAKNTIFSSTCDDNRDDGFLKTDSDTTVLSQRIDNFTSSDSKAEELKENNDAGVVIAKAENDDSVASFKIVSTKETFVSPYLQDVLPVMKKTLSTINSDVGKVNVSKVSKVNENKQKLERNQKKYTFSGSSASEGNLLKLTKDVLKNLPFKFSKDDLFGTGLSRFNQKKEPTNIHELDVISLECNEKETDAVRKQKSELSSELDPKIDMKDLYFENGKTVDVKKDKKMSKDSKIMKKSVLKADLEKQHSAPIVNETMTQKMKNKKKKKGETAGPGWFNLPKTEITDDLKKDLQIIKLRNMLDPKRYYKKSNKKMPTYFQVGTVVENATEFYSSRITKKERKRTMVDELLHDAEFRRRNKKKYLEIQKKKESGGKKYYKKMKNKRKPTWSKDKVSG